MSQDGAAARFFASASRGTEEVLAGELRELGLAPVAAGRGGVSFGTGLEEAYRACLWSRVASRVLLPLARFEAEDAASLYEGVHAIPWCDHLAPTSRFAVKAAGAPAAAGPSHFIALKTKDALVDRIREEKGSRPSVDKARPDLRVHVHTHGSAVTVSLDLAGRGLHRRGSGRRAVAAPLRENLAAALLRLAGWPSRAESAPLLDPLCGSGTLLLEAAAMALDVAPGLARGSFGAPGWLGHDGKLWSRLLSEARERASSARGRRPRLAGRDASRGAVAAGRQVISRAGFSEHVRIEPGELRDAAPPWEEAGLVITNPPYGERLGEEGELGPLYELLGDVLRRRFPGWTAWVLSGNRALEKRIGLRPASRTTVFNGPIACRFLEIPIHSEKVAGGEGPGWRRPGPEAVGFARQLRKRAKERARWARREGVSCYRLYDADNPVFNLAVDWYDGAVRVEEYARPRRVDAAAADRRLRDAMRVAAEVLAVPADQVVLRVRRRVGPHGQHGRFDDRRSFREVEEGGLRFRVNLGDYLDTGLFLDDRLLRRRIRESATGADFLNLFAYTCAASVAAAAGGALTTTSVDLSRTYLDWGKANFTLNGLAGGGHRFLRADVIRFLRDRRDRRRYGLVFVAPPTRSRSKGMSGDFEVQRDHVSLLNDAGSRLAPGGEILFATNLRDFRLEESGLRGLVAEEITEAITPLDFAERPRQRAWSLRAAGASGR
jgi:23S rRNA (guanine2445-N2)-methyltransferase / 23S rRNA (guanine2069-N7)-methyltransferase